MLGPLLTDCVMWSKCLNFSMPWLPICKVETATVTAANNYTVSLRPFANINPFNSYNNLVK